MELMSGTRRLAGCWSLLIVVALNADVAFALETSAVGKVLRVNGIEMYYETSGTGPPLVLLHEFNGSGATWAGFVPEFTQSYQVIVPDLRGHGRSTNPTKQFTHAPLTRCCSGGSFGTLCLLNQNDGARFREASFARSRWIAFAAVRS